MTCAVRKVDSRGQVFARRSQQLAVFLPSFFSPTSHLSRRRVRYEETATEIALLPCNSCHLPVKPSPWNIYIILACASPFLLSGYSTTHGPTDKQISLDCPSGHGVESHPILHWECHILSMLGTFHFASFIIE